MSGDVEGKLRDVLVRIRRAWPRQDEPRVTERSRQVPGPRVPLPAGWLTRDTVAGDLDYWADVAENDGVVPYRDGRDVVATAGHLLANVDALAAWGVPDVVVNNAGVTVTRPLLEQTEEDFKRGSLTSIPWADAKAELQRRFS